MRKAVVPGAVALVAVVLTATAGSATSLRYYQRFSVDAYFVYEIDYGSDPRSTFNGTYSRSLSYTINAITVFDGKAVWAPRDLMLVSGSVSVTDKREVLSGKEHVPYKCGKPGSENGADDVWNSGSSAARSSAGRVGVTNKGLTVDPGAAFNWNVGCYATEQLESHGLPGGPGFRLPAPPKSKFKGEQRFQKGCTSNFSHGFDFPGQPKHSFSGGALISVRFTPFDSALLDAKSKALRKKVGKKLDNPTGVPSPNACPKP